MRFELPHCRRCCFCLPLRHGIIIFGYLNLGFSLLLFAAMLWVSIGQRARVDKDSMIIYRGVNIITQLWFGVVLYGLEVVFNVVLLIGAHMKKPKLMRVYYYYGITTTVASFVTFILLIDFYEGQHWDLLLSEAALAFCGIILQIYLLLLIRSELEKLRTNGGFRFVNHEGEFVVHLPGMGEGDGRNPL